MKNKGFTLVELILVVVILGIISAITVPAIMKSLSESKSDSGEAIENLLKENLELYNIDNKEDIWTEDLKEKNIDIAYLYSMNPDIDMGECLLQNNNKSLLIKKDDNGNFTYEVKIICGKDLTESSSGSKVIADLNSATNYYYKTKEK